MTVKEIINKWIQANRNFVRGEFDQKTVHDQSAIPPMSIYDVVHEKADPTFVLSTGRCGTKLLTEILIKTKGVDAIHSPAPEPMWHSNWAYQNHKTNPEQVRAAVDALRYEMIRTTYLVGRKYVETNNRITFFAHQLASLYPNAKFIHLYRKPMSFVNSGLGRNWYSNKIITDEGRLLPTEEHRSKWNSYSQVEKIAWLWNETNQFIEDFKASVPSSRTMTVSAENFFKDPKYAREMLEFIGIESISDAYLARRIKRPVNKQKKRRRTSVSEDHKPEVVQLTPLAKLYYGDA